MATPTPSRPRAQNLAESVYRQLKSELFEFQLLPGDRFTEGEVADRTGASRTPVRQALYRLQREGFLAVNFRSGWEVRPLDFEQLDALYDLRILLEQASVRRMENLDDEKLDLILTPLERRWNVPAEEQTTDGRQVASWDEDFHCSLVAASGNSEFARVHAEVTDRIRIVRRLDFTQHARIVATFREHASMLSSLRERAFSKAAEQLARHIECSRDEARKLTLLKLQSARQNLAVRHRSSGGD